MRMPEAVGGPADLRRNAKIGAEEVVADGVLVDDVINVANSLVVLDPPAIGQVQLTLFEQLFHLFLLIGREIVIPILEKHHLRHEVFSLSVAGKRLEHGVENSFGVALVHSVEESSRTEVYAFEVIVSIQPKCIEMRVEGHQKLLRILGTLRVGGAGEEREYDEGGELIQKHQQSRCNNKWTCRLIILIVMISPPPQESPRIAKIASSAQQFRELINSLRNNQIRARQLLQAQQDTTEISPNNDNPSQISPSSTQKEKLIQNNNLFETVENDEQTLKVVPKTEVGGRDQLKKQKMAFDSKPEQQKLKIVESKREAGVQFEQSKSKQISFSFESPRKSVSIQCQAEQNSFTTPNQSTFLMHASKNNQKAGQIVRQQLKNDIPLQSQSSSSKRIRDINESVVIDYCRKQKLVEKSQPSEIFTFFTNLCLSCDAIIRSPSIKKFKNCIYYGYAIAKDEPYEGFLYFYDHRIYYGQFMNGLKHGLGVELAYHDQIKFKGEFLDGRKSGKFYVEKPNQKYIGYLENGLYHGEGRLTTPDYVYQGLFEQGEKNGYGQQFYPKTGVKISGMFKNGVLAKSRASRSIAELREKSKGREKERLQQVRKKSLEKHSARMNRVRNSFRESEYEIDFQPQTDYNELPRIHYNPSKLDVYRQPIQKFPRIAHQNQHSAQPVARMEPLTARNPHNDFRKGPRQRSSRFLGVNPQRLSSSENEEPLPTPCLSYPRRQQ